jgi:Fe-S-cluster containining protein
VAGEPWYRKGLNFTCTRCGNCCTGAPGFVWVTDREIADLAVKTGVTAGQFIKMYTRQVGGRITLRDDSDGDCIFYDRVHGCTVYDSRPDQCRTWPFWESTAGTPEAWERTKSKCPGAGQGEFIPVEEITMRMKVVRL